MEPLLAAYLASLIIGSVIIYAHEGVDGFKSKPESVKKEYKAKL